MAIQSRPRRLAFTLVELLVVIAIIGILVALLLPAVQAAREAARRAACVNNIKNVALAAINYHDQRGHFPVDEDYFANASVIDADLNSLSYRWSDREGMGGVPEEGLDGGGWIVRVLPYLEEQSLYDQFDVPGHGLNGNWNGAPTELGMNWTLGASGLDLNGPFATALGSQPSVLSCPSDEYAQPQAGNGDSPQFPYSSGSLVPGGPLLVVATTSYKGNAGDGHFEFEPLPEPEGFWTYPAPVQAPPGSVNRPFQCYAADECVGIFWRTTYINGGTQLRQVTDGASNTFLVGETSPVDRNSAAWSSDGDWAVTAVELNWDYLNDGACTDSNGNLNTGFRPCWPRLRGFRSFHPGGANFANCDGSVVFVTDDIDHLLYRARSSRSGGEVIN